MTQKEIVTYLINANKSLNATYNLYQGIIKSIDKRDKETFLNMEKYIVNAFMSILMELFNKTN